MNIQYLVQGIIQDAVNEVEAQVNDVRRDAQWSQVQQALEEKVDNFFHVLCIWPLESCKFAPTNRVNLTFLAILL